MGDLRNKIEKQIRDELHRLYMAKRYPPKPPGQLPKCRCGNTYKDVIQWQFGRELYCPGCLPYEHFELVMWEVANLPDSEP